ncbi:MAG TPA: nucleotidyltransferase domain-containing protein [Candidatus Eisenbacteria bacterium]|nr:nucleotidyltransferase domain-containing protein [Candidatus Eisenbacteria bacterium]
MANKPDDKLQKLVSRLEYACGEELVSVVLYGSAARDEFHEQYSDINLLIVLRHMKPDIYPALNGVLKWWSQEEKLRPPTIMTLDELRESADVFAIEMLDIQGSHKTLHGEDVVSDVDVPMNLHRVEVEHDLRTTLLRLRNHLLLTNDGDEELKLVMAKSVTSVLTLFRHALIALGETPPSAKPKVLEHAAEVFGFREQPLRTVLELRSNGHAVDNVRGLYHAYMDAILTVAHGLDVKVPKRQWRKQT